jgi:mRNA interferase YafQ
MNSKRTPSSKRAALPRACDFTKAFVKDWVRLAHSGRYDLRVLKEGMLLLVANDGPLGAEWRDHALTGNWADHRECHIGGDFLLIYRLSPQSTCEQVVFVRAGTHADLFE